MRRLLSFALALLLLAALPAAALAEGYAVTIATAEDFIRFAKSCTRESYSLGRRFVLAGDVDLSGLDCEPVPYFAGSFDGDGHWISGFSFAGEGSRQGLFRQIGPGGSVENLCVRGEVLPGGSQEYIGGLAGVNEGALSNCRFEGEVHGIRNVGGLVGHNGASGSIKNCRFTGTLQGEHGVGGVAGRNDGLLLDCESRGEVNARDFATQGEVHFDLASLSQNDFVDLSDIAGVAGENTGTVQGCSSAMQVGYSFLGYNVGGIVGKNSGFVTGCRNSGSVIGRRDVGGVVGQSIPYAAWNFNSEELQRLRDAVSYLQYLLGRTNQHVQDGRDSAAVQIEHMRTYADDATEALDALLRVGVDNSGTDPATGQPTPPEWDSISTEVSDLNEAMANLYAGGQALADTAETTAGALAKDLQDISNQMGYILNLVMALLDSGQNLYSRRDLSLEEAYEHSEGAVADSSNSGSVRAEAKAGGVVGNVGFEIAFDAEDMLQASQRLGTRAEQLLFAAIRGCDSSGSVTARTDCAGGIAGSMDLGAVVDCVGAGSIVSQRGDCVGAVVGSSQGSVARCWARGSLEGRRYVGGAAGKGGDVLDCRCWIHIERGAEYLGQTAGWAEGTVRGNLYVAEDPEGVDGVSRVGAAEGLSEEEFLALEGLPEGFDRVTVRFLVGEQTIETLELPYGGTVEELPQVERRSGATWSWDQSEPGRFYCDTVMTGSFYAPSSSIASGEPIPLFLAEGAFYDDQLLYVTPYEPTDAPQNLLAAYTVTVSHYEGELKLRMRSASDVQLYRVGDEGALLPLAFTVDGQYLVFNLPNGGRVLSVGRQLPGVQSVPRQIPLWPLAAGGGGLAALALLLLLRRRKKRRSAAK